MNLLGSETSLYLRQHAENPVHWMPWGDAAFTLARKTGKPILLSVGYSACHWCHVMAHESFEDQATADLMNAHFINIKLDREERPDIDAIYQQALALLGQQGGWPLTMFLTPELKPFWGGTYFPPKAAHGLPSFKNVLSVLAAGWQEDQDKIAPNTGKITAALHSLQQPQAGAAPDEAPLAKILNAIDPVHGGLKGDQKFPTLPLFDFLWTAYIRQQNVAARTAVIDSLVAMCGRGLYDHIGGGFFRYCVDEDWQMPHFEKMLNDQALFLSLLGEVVREVPHPLFLNALRDTALFLRREMLVAHKESFAYAVSLDADSRGVEGGYYLTETSDLTGTLTLAEIDAAKAYYEFPHLYPKSAENFIPDASLRDRLLAARGKKPAPARDDKILADANGRIICGLVSAYDALGDETFLADARAVFDFICAFMMQPDHRLAHSFCGGRPQEISFADDYIHMALAALQLYQATGLKPYLTAARRWADILSEDFLDRERGGFFMSPEAQSVFGLRAKGSDDSAVTSTNGAAAELFTALFLLTGDMLFQETANDILRLYAGDATRFPISHGSLLKMQIQSARPLSLSIAASDQAQVFGILKEVSVPGLVRKPGSDETVLCAGRICLPPGPVTELKEKLKTLRIDNNVANDA